MMRTIRYRLAAVLLAILLVFCAGASAESYDASTMRLLRYAGEIEILDASGNPRFVMENARFGSGETLITHADSGASVSLDSSKIVTLDADTRALFAQEGSHLKLTLQEGSLFLDVQEKLDENQTLDIETSTMTVGIRGTIVYVVEQAAKAADSNADGAAKNGMTQLTVLEGTAEITYQDENGTRRKADVPAGKTAVIERVILAPGSGLENLNLNTLHGNLQLNYADSPPSIHDTTLSDLHFLSVADSQAATSLSDVINNQNLNGNNSLILNYLANNLTVPGRIEAADGVSNLSSGAPSSETNNEDEPYPANGTWEYTGEVIIVAQSASKLFDGTSLSRVNDVLVYGLPSIFSIDVTCSGSQTAVGIGTNKVDSWTISNKTGENVNSHFPHVKVVDGSLVVSKAPIVIWTGSAEKVYDGEPLTCEEAGIRVTSGTTDGGASLRNSAMVTTSSTGGAMMYGVSGATWVHVTNPFNGKSQDLLLNAGECLNVNYSPSEGKDAGIELEIVQVEDIHQLPVEVLLQYAENRELMEQACEDAGWDPEELWALVQQTVEDQKNAPDGDQTRSELMLESVDVRLTVDTAVTSGGVRSLGNEEAHFTPVHIPTDVTVTATGEQTEVGESDNTCEVTWGESEDPDNYSITYELGKLTVTAPEQQAQNGSITTAVTLTAGSAEKIYDGTPLMESGVTAAGLPEGYTLEATTSGSQTDAGNSDNTVASYVIHTANNTDVTRLFTNVTLVAGTLTVTPAEVTVTTGSETKMYDGTPLTCEEAEITGLVGGETATVIAMGSITHVGTAENTYTIEWGTAKAANYTMSDELGTLEVTPNSSEVTFTATIAEKPYDGTPLEATADSVTVTGLPEGFTYTVTVTGRQEGAGTSESEITDFIILSPEGETVEMGSKARAGEDVTLYFTGATTVKGTLTIDPAEVKVTTGSASKPYDGTPLMCDEAEITGLIEGETAAVTATGSITEVGTTENTYTLDWGETNPDNYIVTDELGTLEVTENETGIIFKAPTAEKVYDGTALEADADAVTVTGLPEGFTYTAEVSGSQTGVGSSESEITNFTILSGEEDVTDQFTDVQTVKGALTITAAPVTITTGSASKAYDGTALTSMEAGITGLVTGETAAVTATGTITDVGTAENTYTIDWGTTDKNNYAVAEKLGTLEVTANSTEITFTAPTAEKVYDGTALTVAAEQASVSGLPAGFTYTATVSGSQTGVGSSDSEIATYAILDGNGKNVTANFTGIKTVKGKLTVTAVPVTITTGSASKAYDGKALTSTEAGITGMVTGETATVTATGTITDVGTAENTYTIDWGTTDKNNYAVTENLGTLEVTANSTEITFTAPTAEKVYDGTALTAAADQVSVSGLPAGFTYTATVSGTQTNAGSSDSEIATCVILDGNGKNVTANFTGIKTVKGKLTVTTVSVTITTGSASKAYDGKALTSTEAGITGLVTGETAAVTATGTITDVGTAENTYTIDWGTTDENNYAVTEKLGTLEVTANNTEITFTAPTTEKVYDGTALEANATAVVVTGLPDGLAYTVTVSGTQTNAGSSDSEITAYTILDGTGKDETANFTCIKTAKGKLTVNPKDVTITAASKAFIYDGTAHSNADYETTGLIGSDAITAVVEGTITYPSESPVANTVKSHEFTTGTPGNYNVSCVNGSLTMTNASIPITITSASGSWTYDGAAHADNTVTITSGTLLTGDTLEATATGSVTNVADTAEGNNTIAAGYKVKHGTEDVTANYVITTANGTLTIAPITEAVTVTITGNSGTKTYNGSEQTVTGYTVNSISNALYTEGDFTCSGEATAKGTNVDTYGMELEAEDFTNINTNFATVNFDVTDGSITIDPKDVTITAASEAFTYDGTAHSNAGYETTGLIGNDAITAVVEGTITFAGESPVANTITSHSFTTGMSGNYNVSYVNGELTMTNASVPITITSASESWTYDGTAHTNNMVTVTSGALLTGDELDAKATGSVTDVADTTTGNNPIATGYRIMHGDVEVTENYVITTANGTLTVNPKAVTITAKSEAFTYDGTAHSNAGYETTELIGTDAISAVVEGAITFVSESPVTNAVTSYTFTTGTPGNYNVTTENGTLTMMNSAVEITITSASDSWMYDGTAHTNNTVTVTSGTLLSGDELSATATGSVMYPTDTVEKNNRIAEGYKIMHGSEDVTANYDITTVYGTLTINPNTTEITIKPLSASKTYDGTALTVTTEAIGLPTGFTHSAEIRFSEIESSTESDSVTNAGSGSCWVTDYSILDSTGVNVKDCFTKVTMDENEWLIEPRTIVIKMGSASKEYDGTPLTCHSGEVENLVSGERLILKGTGSVTSVGEGEVPNNLDYIIWDSALESNYYYEEVIPGKLWITPNTSKITVTVDPLTKVYDGDSLEIDPEMGTYPDINVEGLPAGFDWWYELSSDVIYNVGEEGHVTVTEFGLMYNEEDVDMENFSNIEYKSGTMSITPLQIDIDAWDQTMTADSTEYVNFQPGWFEISYTEDNETIGVSYDYEITSDEKPLREAELTFSVVYGETIVVSLSCEVQLTAQGGTELSENYQINHSFDCDGGSKGNYTINFSNMELHVQAEVPTST